MREFGRGHGSGGICPSPSVTYTTCTCTFTQRLYLHLYTVYHVSHVISPLRFTVRHFTPHCSIHCETKPSISVMSSKQGLSSLCHYRIIQSSHHFCLAQRFKGKRLFIHRNVSYSAVSLYIIGEETAHHSG